MIVFQKKEGETENEKTKTITFCFIEVNYFSVRDRVCESWVEIYSQWSFDLIVLFGSKGRE